MKRNTSRKKKILISGYYGFDNFGDEAILFILVRELLKLDSTLEIVILSKNPEKTSAQTGVKSINRMNPAEIIKELLNADLLISGGGSLLQDVTGPITIYYYLAIIYLAQIFRVKTFIYAQGIGPINKKASWIITQEVLKNATYISVRDNNSLKLIQSMRLNATLTSDPVWLGMDNAETDTLIAEKFNLLNKRQLIGINLRSWPGVGMLELQDFARAINNIALETNANILLLPLQLKQDLDICKNFYEILLTVNCNLNVQIIEESLTPVEWNSVIKQCNIVIAMRFHALLIAILQELKVFGLSYDPKVKTLLDSISASYLTVEEWKENKIQEKILNWYRQNSNNISYNKELINQNKDLAGQNLENIIKLL